jgi:hypothetical protein
MILLGILKSLEGIADLSNGIIAGFWLLLTDVERRLVNKECFGDK